MITDSQAIRDAERQLEFARDEFLRRSGWKYTCKTPGSFWMFEKLLPDGRTILLHQEDAVRMQSIIEDLEELDRDDQAE